MPQTGKQQFGDGHDNFAGAAKQGIKLIKSLANGSKAGSTIATGTAAGGVWGAALSAAWSMRHTLFKVLVCMGLFLLIMTILLVTLPTIVTNSVFGLNGVDVDLENPVSLSTSYDSLAGDVADVVQYGYDLAFTNVEKMVMDGGYDYEASMEALTNYAQSTAGYDVSYILAAYSVSMEQQNTAKDDMIQKLTAVAGLMFPITSEVRTYTTTTQVPSKEDPSVMENVPVTVEYLACTIHPFDVTVISTAFGLNMSAQYGTFTITCGDAIRNMANALKMTLYGTMNEGQAVPLSDAELIAFVKQQAVSGDREKVLTTALSLVGKVPYFWGGKSAPGWNDAWNTPKLVTAAGSASSGTIRPFGLDCSGFTSWVYSTALGIDIGAGCNAQYAGCSRIRASQLEPGDLGFLRKGEDWDHCLIFAGYGSNGERMWVHCASGSGVILNSPSYESSLSYARLSSMP